MKWNAIRNGACLVAMALFFMSGACLAEDMQFVDANGSTGYYVDTDSISYENTKEGDTPVTYVCARIAVVRADDNRRYLYAMKFEPAKSTYRIMASEVQAYDTKETIETSAAVELPRRYGANSPMKEIVDFIMQAKRP